jgi:hypothetical protein
MLKMMERSLRKKSKVIEKIIEPTILNPDDWLSVIWSDGLSGEYMERIRTLHEKRNK